MRDIEVLCKINGWEKKVRITEDVLRHGVLKLSMSEPMLSMIPTYDRIIEHNIMYVELRRTGVTLFEYIPSYRIMMEKVLIDEPEYSLQESLFEL